MIVIHLARKPLDGTVANNAAEHGTGGLNIDASRIAVSAGDAKQMQRANSPGSWRMKASGSGIGTFQRSSSSGPLDTSQGRWPANLIIAGQAVADALDEQSGDVGCHGGGSRTSSGGLYEGGFGNQGVRIERLDAPGGASRFFKVLKGD